jgi:hypothetical protein
MLCAAAILAFLVGLVHSILGELLIFQRMRQGKLIPTNGGKVVGEGHVRILWASWHVLTVLGWCLAAILFWLSQGQLVGSILLTSAIAIAMLVSSLLVLVGTKAKHPGWVGLLGVSLLVWFSGA